MISTFILITLALFTGLTNSLQDIDLYDKKNATTGHHFHDNVLCRGCGNEITFSSSLMNKISPFSQHSYHDSLFNQHEVLIQVFTSDMFLPYPVLTTSQSSCVGVSEWEEEDSWFPGYQWKPCVCSECGALVGWVFKPINPSFVDQPETFYGLILTNLIGESFLKSLSILPEAQSNL